MTKLQAGYLIDEIFDLFFKQKGYEDFEKAIAEFSKFCYFELSGLEEFELNENTESFDKVLLIAYNIINRGTPTRASLFITEKILSQYGYQIKNNNKTGDVVFHRSNAELINISNVVATIYSTNNGNRDVYNVIYTPILIAQIQKSFLLLWLNEIVSVSNVLKIHCNEKMQQYFEWAFTDLFEIIENLHSLNGTRFESPTLVYSGQEDADFSLGIEEQGYNFTINRLTDSDYVIDRVLTNKKITYPQIGEYDLQNKFISFEKQHKSLLYFLNNLFRKNEFRDGQLPIINRILQCKDVIGILPTGSGKSLSYQLSTLLQPGVCIVVDPIKSLMKDQFDKLRINFIDKCVFINSEDDKEERQEKEDLIAKGKFQYIIVGPERLQIQEFRNALDTFRRDGLFFSYLVIDEAHCISEWGHDFRYAYLRLSNIVLENCFDNVRDDFVQIALTATASFDVMADIQREINVDNESLLQPPDLDREELHFHVKTFPSFAELDNKRNHTIKDGLYDYWKERTLAHTKYPIIKELLSKELPYKLSELNDDISVDSFWSDTDGIYKNAGIIYCPTKSDSKGNGVFALCYDMLNQRTGEVVLRGLNTEHYLVKGTYFGGGDDNSWENKRIEKEAKKASENQSMFMQNKLNLIVATKAFGMGLDKPNVRFTIHYCLPTSIEAFYQEAGRAGRDGTESFNYILYSPSDLESNLDNIKNAHKGVLREYKTFNELLTEINYEDGFGVTILNSIFQQKYPKYSLSLYIKPGNNNHYLYVNPIGIKKDNDTIVRDKTKELLSLLFIKGGTDIKSYPNEDDRSKAEEIGQYIISLIKELANGMNFIEFLKIKTAKGIESLLNESNTEQRLFIGFNNNVIEDLGKLIEDRDLNGLDGQGRKNKIFGSRVVRSAYNFCDGENETAIEEQFIKNLEYQYERDGKEYKFNSLNLNEDFLKEMFWKLRNSSDTQRAIYRLNVLGVIDDYTVDYANNIIELTFKKQVEGFYFSKLKNYLLKYIGETEAERILEEAKNRNSEYDRTELSKCLNALTDFYAKAITEKRIHSANYVKEAIDVFLKDGEKSFRDKINNYFSSKYAEDFYRDFVLNTELNYRLIEKYLALIKNPDESNPGLEIDNLKHLIGSCERYEVGSAESSNDVITILKNTALLIINTRGKKLKTCDNLANLIFMKLTDFIATKKLSIEQVIELIQCITKYSYDLEPDTQKYTTVISKTFYFFWLGKMLKKFNHKFITK